LKLKKKKKKTVQTINMLKVTAVISKTAQNPTNH